MLTCRYNCSPLCLLYKPQYKWVKYQDAGGLRASEASLPFSHWLPQRFLPASGLERRNDAPPREKWLDGATVLVLLCSMSLRTLPDLPPPPFCLITNRLLSALPQAAPRNYSPMPQTGEMGVCYTPHAELRKTTTVGPLFVNQTQGQKTKHCLPHPESITVENCRAEEHCIDLFSCLFLHYRLSCFSDLWWALELCPSKQGSDTVPSQQHQFGWGKLYFFLYFVWPETYCNGDTFPAHLSGSLCRHRWLNGWALTSNPTDPSCLHLCPQDNKP